MITIITRIILILREIRITIMTITISSSFIVMIIEVVITTIISIILVLMRIEIISKIKVLLLVIIILTVIKMIIIIQGQANTKRKPRYGLSYILIKT